MVVWAFLWFITVLVASVTIFSGAWIPSIAFIKWYAGFCIVASFLTWINQIGKH